MPERSVAVQLELPADPQRPLPGSSVSELQLDRAQQKPLVASCDFPEYGITEITSRTSGRVQLRRRPDAQFADGKLVAVEELVNTLTRGQLFPASGDARFEHLNTERLQSVIAANEFFAARLSKLRLNKVKAVKAYHHGLFSTVSLRDITSPADARMAAQDLVRSLVSRGVPAAARGSFGLDMTAIDCYLDLTDPSAAPAATLRIAMGDCSRAVASSCVDGVYAWVRCS